MHTTYQAIITLVMENHALQLALTIEKINTKLAAEREARGVTLSAWSQEDLATFRAAAQATWPEFADTPEAESLLESHLAKTLGLGRFPLQN